MGQSIPTEANHPRWRRHALRLAVLLAGGYLGVLVVLMLLENRLVFHPTRADTNWGPPPTADTRDVWLTCADGTRLHAWWAPRAGSDRTLLYCHGNGGNLSGRAGSVRKLMDALDTSVLIFDYPGYGKSDGTPTERGCYEAADAAYDWLVNEQKADPARLFIHGDSLGGGVAVNLAGRKEHGGLILVRTFTLLPEVGARIYPWLPVRWVMRSRFDSLGTIGGCRRPTFIAHGTADTLIPFALGRELFDAANEPKCFCPLEGLDHNDVLPDAMYARLHEFMRANGCCK
jgi:fermentation-respiration switch protein FrsA (DUF1100 family)